MPEPVDKEQPSNARPAPAPVVLTAAAAVFALILIAREFLVAAGGFEPALGAFLGAWIFWAALGAFASRQLAPGRHAPRLLGLSLFTALLALIAARGAGLFLDCPSPAGAMLLAAAALAPFGFLSGLALCAVGKSVPAGRLVALIGAGAVAGALAFALCAPWLTHAGSAGRAELLEAKEILAERNTLQGNLVAARLGDKAAIYLDGRLATPYSSKMAREDAILACGQPKSLGRALLVGGGQPDLVREILARGAFALDVVAPDRNLDAMLAPGLSEADRAAQVSPRVRYFYGDVRRFLRRHRGAPYDLAVLVLPDPGSILAATFCSVEFHRELAARMGRGGVLVILLPRPQVLKIVHDVKAPASFSLGQARLLAALKEVYPPDSVAAIPGWGGPVYFLAAPVPGTATLDPAVAATRYAAHVMPAGGAPPAVDKEIFARLLDEKQAVDYTRGLDSLELEPETLRTPRIFLEFLRAGERDGLSARMIGAALAVPIWAYFAALWVLLIAGGLIARRQSAGALPAPLARAGAAFFTGLAVLGGGAVLLLVFQAQCGVLYGRLALLVAAFAAGWGLGGATAERLAGRFRSSPRRALACLGFGFLLVLLCGIALDNFEGEAGWACLAVGLALAALGWLGGLEIGALGELDPRPGAVALPAGLGALCGGILVGGGFLAVLGPAAACMLLLGAKAVELGWLAAGAGRSGGGAA